MYVSKNYVQPSGMKTSKNFEPYIYLTNFALMKENGDNVNG